MPIYSVDTEEEAKQLLAHCCPLDLAGYYVARELLNKQTVENLYAFGRRLAAAHAVIKQAEKSKQRELFKAPDHTEERY